MYNRTRRIHDDLIARYGQGVITYSVTTTVPGIEEWDPPVTTTVDEPLAGVVHGVAAEFVDGSSIVSSDLVVQTAVPSVIPDVGDSIKIDGRSVAVLAIKPVPGAGDPVAVRMICRG